MFLFGVLGAHPIAHKDKKNPHPKMNWGRD